MKHALLHPPSAAADSQNGERADIPAGRFRVLFRSRGIPGKRRKVFSPLPLFEGWKDYEPIRGRFFLPRSSFCSLPTLSKEIIKSTSFKNLLRAIPLDSLRFISKRHSGSESCRIPFFPSPLPKGRILFIYFFLPNIRILA